MLSQAFLPVDPNSSMRQSLNADIAIHIPTRSATSDDESVRPSDAQHEDILLPYPGPLRPQSSADSDAVPPQRIGPSPFRRYFTSTLFVYLSVLSLASFAVLALVPHGSCSHGLVVYILGNAVVSALLASLTLYASCSAPVDLSQLAVVSERREPIRWVALTCVKQLLGVADFCFFVIGNVGYFSSTSDECAASSPALHSFALASLISGYVGFVVPLLTFLYLTHTYRQYIFRPRALQQQRQRPAHADEIAACEKLQWKAVEAEADGEEVAVLCSICYTDFVDGDTLLQLPCDVKHTYHEPCITQWLSIRDTCPLCKTRLRHSLQKAGKASAPPGRRERAVAARPHTVPGRASLDEIAPFLPGTMAASYSLTAAYQHSHDHKEDESCPTPSPVGTPTLDAPLLNRADKELMEDDDTGVEVRICVGGGELEGQSIVAREAVVGNSTSAAVGAAASARIAAVAAALARLAVAKTAAPHPTV